jgi:hypothetical protein
MKEEKGEKREGELRSEMRKGAPFFFPARQPAQDGVKEILGGRS